MRSSGGIRGLGGVACFTRDSLRSRIYLGTTDDFAGLCGSELRGVSPSPQEHFYWSSYFPSASSSYAIHNGPNGDPFIDIYADITQLSSVGEVILIGDFNSHTRSLQIPFHNQSEDVFCIQEIDLASVGLHRMSDDALGPLTPYGRHLLQLGESQELLILNRHPCFPDSRFFTCWPHGGGASVVDYVLSSQNLLPFIRHFFVSPIPLTDHALLSFSLWDDTTTPPDTPHEPTPHYLPI